MFCRVTGLVADFLQARQETRVCMCVFAMYLFLLNLIVHYIPSSKSHKTEQVVTKWVKNIEIIVKKSDNEEKEETRGIFKVLKANTHF